MVMLAENRRYNWQDIIAVPVNFMSTAAPQDIDLLAYAPRGHGVRFIGADVMFHALDTFASNATLTVEKDDGSTETILAQYVTVAGTAVKTLYRMDLIESVAIGEGAWAQVHVDHNEDVATGFSMVLYFAKLDL